MIRIAIAAALMLAAPAAADDEAASTTPPEQLYVEYTGSLFFIPVADISVNAGFGADGYSADARFQSAGLLRWFDDTDIVASTGGYREGLQLQPQRYEHINRASNKGRVVGIDFAEGTAIPDVQPPFGSMGEPPASESERAGAVDPISAMLDLTLNHVSQEGEPCNGRVPVFDGKARYDLRLESGGSESVRTRAWRGDAVICRAYLEPISGYDPEDRPSEEETARPVTIWLARVNDVHVPIRFRANTQIGEMTIQARRLVVR
ncbi:DUF3108 domain-containing protein [Marinicauda salina]|uniref:DUF3108 domain-containing protein n=1 Tax=Marinicauda salina TaxID=2135793 RepID=A0A2U2BS56_9PROT|nr:DUF3108 domain-containing protein [Marinicauda salina]PWE16822.1 DUF3108 domain-containing protein [Marinicauda salina]